MDNLNQKQERFGIRLAECRRNKNFTQEGILLPTIRIMDQQCIKAKEFYILAYDNVLYREELAEINEETCDPTDFCWMSVKVF